MTVSVFSSNRELAAPAIDLPAPLQYDARLRMEGLAFLAVLPSQRIPIAFFDPQYRGLLDKMQYGNEGQSRGRARSALRQMDDETIGRFVRALDRVLLPSGHLFLWTDKFHLCTGITPWLAQTRLSVVDLITWNKDRMGMGYRTRRQSEYLVILQKAPRRAKGVWKIHNIPDTWTEKVPRNGHTHRKPVGLQRELIRAVSSPGDIVLDPAAGSFSVMEACAAIDRKFLGCDLEA